jgi:hypothetical protein
VRASEIGLWFANALIEMMLWVGPSNFADIIVVGVYMLKGKNGSGVWDMDARIQSAVRCC